MSPGASAGTNAERSRWDPTMSPLNIGLEGISDRERTRTYGTDMACISDDDYLD
jgi:hypothetical protein